LALFEDVDVAFLPPQNGTSAAAKWHFCRRPPRANLIIINRNHYN